MGRLACCCGLFLAAQVHALTGQTSDDRNLSRLLSAGDWVQVTIPGTLIEVAEVYRVTPDSLHVVDGGQEWLLPGARIQALSVRVRKTQQYATAGVIGGALFGLAAQVFLNPVLCNRPDGCNEGFATGAAIGGVVFGLGVGLMGYHEFRWKPLIP